MSLILHIPFFEGFVILGPLHRLAVLGCVKGFTELGIAFLLRVGGNVERDCLDFGHWFEGQGVDAN